LVKPMRVILQVISSTPEKPHLGQDVATAFASLKGCY
jgi:hypothetical protein